MLLVALVVVAHVDAEAGPGNEGPQCGIGGGTHSPLVFLDSQRLGRNLSWMRRTKLMVRMLHPVNQNVAELHCVSGGAAFAVSLLTVVVLLSVESLMSAISVSEGKVRRVSARPAASRTVADPRCFAVQCQVHGPQTADGGCAHHRATYSGP